MTERSRTTRIVATIGPASAKSNALGRLLRAGMDVARLNMSHGEQDEHREVARELRRLARRNKRPAGILVDLQGPKLRLGPFEEVVKLMRGDKLRLTTRRADVDVQAREPILPVDYDALTRELQRGQQIMLADGALRLEVTRVTETLVHAKVVEGGALRGRAGIALPDSEASRSALTAKDKRDLRFAAEIGADFVALSFVRRAEDMREARRLLKRAGSDALLIAKIETARALEELDEIIAESDGVMVARGDLGVELPPERVPTEQKRIIRLSSDAGKPVITATQMLESMREATRPTRAEASDVANAVLDGSWAVMLSAETAIGAYPIRSVEMMQRIVVQAERLLMRGPRRRSAWAATTVDEGIALAGGRLALEIGAVAIVALTRSGATARQIARQTLPLRTIAYTPSERTLQRMTLFRGIEPRILREQRSLERAIDALERDLLKRRDARKGELVVILGGAPGEPLGVTNRLVVRRIEAPSR